MAEETEVQGDCETHRPDPYLPSAWLFCGLVPDGFVDSPFD
jgi:hypothetical protein